MCLAVPVQILEINSEMAVVEISGNFREVNISLIENPRVGEYVLLHAGFAIERVDEETAKEIFEIEGMG